MATLSIPLDTLFAVLLIFLRVVSILFSAPIFDSEIIPVTFKAGLGLAVSLLLLPVVHLQVDLAGLNLLGITLSVVSEIFIGLAIGFAAKLFFTGIQLAGQIAGYQMGIAIANVVDPVTSAQIPVLGQFYNLTAMLLFVTVDAHHMFFKALVDSYTLIPLSLVHISPSLVEMVMKLAATMFVLSIKVGAPLIAVLLMTSVSLGLVARTVPQMNIFIVAMPLKIVIGLVFMMMTASHLTAFMIDLFASLRTTVYALLHLMAGSG